MPYRWPSDPPGRPARHTRPYAGGQGLAARTGPPAFGTGAQRLTRPAVRPAVPRPASPGLVRPAVPRPAAPSVGTGAPGGPPVDPIFDQTFSNLVRQRDTTLAGLSSQRQQGLADYGYTETPTTGALAFDPNNPFSKAAQLKRLYDTDRRAAGQRIASTGGLYSGGYQNVQDLANRNQLGAQDTMQKALAGFLARNTSERAAAGTSYKQQLGTADVERLGRIATNPTYSPTAAAAAPPKPKPKPPRPPKARHPKPPKARHPRARARNRKR